LVYSANSTDAVIGDSHIYRAFIDDDKFVHLARGGLSPKAMRIVGEHYFARRRPNRLIIGVGPQLLGRDSATSRLSDHFGQYDWFGKGLYAFESGIQNHAAWLNKPSRLKREQRRARDDRRSKGQWQKVDDDRRRQRLQTGLDEQRPRWPDTAGQGITDLIALVTMLTAKGAKVCLLRTPIVDVYRQRMNQDADYIRAERELRSLAPASASRYVDYIDLDLSLKQHDFLNQDHLAASASKRFVDAAAAACFI
jgi:hypothetical protein